MCLNEVVQEMNVLKGSFYPHFQSTGNCDVGVLMHQPAALNAYKRGPILLDDAAASPRTRLFTFFTSTIASFLENGSECLRQVVKLASEVSDFSEPMQKVLAAAQRIWAFTTEQVFQQCIRTNATATILDSSHNGELINNLGTGIITDVSIARNIALIRVAVSHVSKDLPPDSKTESNLNTI